MDLARFFRLAIFCLMLGALMLPAGCSDDDDNPTGVTPSVSDDLVTVWRPTGVTVDGAAVDVAEFFEFSDGADAVNLTINADGTYLLEELDLDTEPDSVLYFNGGIVESSGQSLTLTMTSENGVALETPMVMAEGTWAVDGFVLTVAVVEDGSTVVITWSNWLS